MATASVTQLLPSTSETGEAGEHASSPTLTPYTVFRVFFPDSLLSSIAQNTNASPQECKPRNFTAVAVPELRVFFGIFMYMLADPRDSILAYWPDSRRNATEEEEDDGDDDEYDEAEFPLLSSTARPIRHPLGEKMAYERFQEIRRNLRVSPADAVDDGYIEPDEHWENIGWEEDGRRPRLEPFWGDDFDYRDGFYRQVSPLFEHVSATSRRLFRPQQRLEKLRERPKHIMDYFGPDRQRGYQLVDYYGEFIKHRMWWRIVFLTMETARDVAWTECKARMPNLVGNRKGRWPSKFEFVQDFAWDMVREGRGELEMLDVEYVGILEEEVNSGQKTAEQLERELDNGRPKMGEGSRPSKRSKRMAR